MKKMRIRGLWAAAALTVLGSTGASAAGLTATVVRYEDDGHGARKVTFEGTEVAREDEPATGASETSWPQWVVEHEPIGARRIVELRSRDPEAVRRLLAERGVAPRVRAEQEGQDEVVTLVDSGPVENRIDLVFMGDGYTAAEREKFFTDIQRMVKDMFEGETFATYLPLFNVHAVFRASKESGIGKGAPKDTAYGLYREGATLRAIFPSRTDAARASCEAAPGCDYPVIIGNDPYYGGLGGEFAISTSSETSGTVVLRHELGHTFGRIGEEYDGGGYFGANWSASVDQLKWRHWASEESVHAEPAVARFLGWPWHDLSRGAYTVSFRSDGNQARSSVRFSASGLLTADQMHVTLDGAPLAFADPGTDDRRFHDVDLDHGFSAGSHELKFVETVHDGNNWVSSLTVHEYGQGYHFEPGFIGAFPVFSESNAVDGYRSNDEMCLMRNMMSPQFCPVCKENNWHEFLGKVRLVDGVEASQGASGVTVTLKTQKLGQFRTDALAGKPEAGRLEIEWLRDGVAVPSLAGASTWTLPTRDARGRWEVRVRYVTPEVRKDERGLLTDKKSLEI